MALTDAGVSTRCRTLPLPMSCHKIQEEVWRFHDPTHDPYLEVTMNDPRVSVLAVLVHLDGICQDSPGERES